MHAPLRFGRYDYGSFFSMGCYAAGSLAVPMTLAEMSGELGLSLSWGGFLQMGRSIAMVATMLFCGVAAARWGKTRTIAGSLLMMGGGVALCAVAPGYGILLCAMALAGLGEGVLEGLLTPYVQDIHPVDSGRYLNFTHAFWSVGTLATVLTVGALLGDGFFSWRVLLGMIGASSLIPFAILMWPTKARREAGRKNGDAAMSVRGVARPRISAGDVGRHTVAILRCRRFWIFFAAMFFAGGGEFSLTFWMPKFIDEVYHGTPWQRGLATAAFAFGMIAGRMGAGVLVRQQYLRRLLLCSGALALAVALAFPLLEPETTPLWAIYLLAVVAGLGAAPLWPSIQSYAADRAPMLDTTMLFVLLSCAGIPGAGFFSWIIGVVGGEFGLKAAFLVPPGAFLVMIGLLLADRRRFYAEAKTVESNAAS